MGRFWENLVDENNRKMTEKGAYGYKTTGKALVDLNFSIPKLRGMGEYEIVNASVDAIRSTPLEYFLKWIFYVRDVRFGLGERKIFRSLFRHVIINVEDYRSKARLIALIPEYGRWDDVIELLDVPQISDIAIVTIMNQLYTDIDNMEAGNPISLLAKWIPNISSRHYNERRLAKYIASHMGMKHAKYRKTISALRSYLDVVEVKMTASEWENINYNTVPSKANLLYNNAFLRHDEMRRMTWLSDLKSGKEGVKVNSSVAFPHEIVYKLRTNQTSSDVVDLCNEMWKALPTVSDDNPCRTLVVRDGSYSMTSCTIPHSSVTPYDVATALTIYFSERMKGEFHNKFITFSNDPQEIDLTGINTLSDKLKYCDNFNAPEETYIDKVFRLILSIALKHNMNQSELPDTILIVSDMEFDAGIGYSSSCNCLSPSRLFDSISESYEEHGYKLPKLVFWNVSNRSGAIPMIENDLGVILVSGYSINIINSIMSGKMNPMDALMDVLNSERYEAIKL